MDSIIQAFKVNTFTCWAILLHPLSPNSQMFLMLVSTGCGLDMERLALCPCLHALVCFSLSLSFKQTWISVGALLLHTRWHPKSGFTQVCGSMHSHCCDLEGTPRPVSSSSLFFRRHQQKVVLPLMSGAKATSIFVFLSPCLWSHTGVRPSSGQNHQQGAILRLP